MDRPDDLSSRGGGFWAHVVEHYELSESETQLLVEVCRTLDTVEALQANREQLQVLRELRQQRVALQRMIAQLGLPDDHGDKLPTPTQRRASKAAHTRWDNVRRMDGSPA